jgi:uncharacterized protein (DUF4415 family)
MKAPNPELIDDDLPELDEAFFVRARPAVEVMGEAFMARARKRGRPRSTTPKTEVKIRLDAVVTAYLRATGKGWQTRVNAALAKDIEEGRL